MAKRVNTRFLIVLTAVFACLITAAVVAKYTVFRPNPGANEAAGDQLVREGQYKQAVERYRFALAGNKNPNALLVKLGETLNKMVADDPDNLQNARAAWRQVLANDPKFEPALERLLDSYWEESELYPTRLDLYPQVRENAERLADLRPGDVSARTKQYIATLRPWLLDLTNKNPGDETIDGATLIDRMKALLGRDPGNADLRFSLAQYWLRKAWEDRQRGETAEADTKSARAVALFDDALKDPPKEPAAAALTHLRAAQVYAELDKVERVVAAAARRSSGPASSSASPDAKAAPAGGAYAAKADQAVAASMEAAKSVPADGQLYFDVHRHAVRWAGVRGRLADAERICDEMLAKRPDDPNVRLLYAEVLAANPTTARRDKAIELLSREVKVEGLVGPRGRNAADLRIVTLIELIGTKIERARAVAVAQPQPGEAGASASAVLKPQEVKQRQDELIADIHKDMGRLDSMVAREAVPVLRLKALLLQLEGRPAEALGMFVRAVRLMEGASQEQKDWNLVYELAQAYLNAGQTGSAKEYVQRIVNQYESNVRMRLQLANLLMSENKLEEARRHVTEAGKHLARLSPDTPEFAVAQADYNRVSLALLNLSKDPQLEERFTSLPEGTRAERLNKAAVARQIKKHDEAIRLAALAVKDDPKDIGAFQMLLNGMLALDRRQEAVSAVERFMVDNPDKAHLLQPVRERLRAAVELADATPQQVYERRRQLIEAEPDSVARSIKLADLERDHNHLDKSEEILLKLHNDHPQDVAVTERLFELNLTHKKWEKSKGYLDKLVAGKGDGADGLLYQFQFARAKGDTAEALRLGRALVNARPEFDVSFVAYAQALQADRRHAEAIQQYQAALKRKPRNVDALRGVIECYYAQNQPNKVNEALNEARVLFPNDPRFREMELRYQLEFGDPMAVVAEREQIQRERPEAPEAWLELATAYRTAARARSDAESARRTELRGKARDLLQKGAAKWDGDARFVVQLAEVALESGDLAAGEKLIQAYAARPDQAQRYEPLVLLAEYYARANKTAEATKAFESALEKVQAAVAAAAAADKKDVAAAATAAANDVRLSLSAHLAGAGQFDDALKVLEVADQAASAGAGAAADRRLFVQKLNVMILAGRRDLAEEALVKALTDNKVAGAAGDVGLQMMLVRVNYEGGRYDEAMERVNKIVNADPDNLEAKFYRGQIQLRKPQPNVAGAVTDLSEVRQGDPRNAATRILLADAYRQQGDTPKAIRELEEGLRLDPLSREMRLRLMDFRSSEGSRDLNEVLRLAGEARSQPQLKTDPTWAYREATVWATRREWPRAIAAIEDAVKLAPGDVRYVREYQSILLQAENFKPVLDQTDRLVRDNKAPWWVFMNRGVAKNGLKDQAGAMGEFNLALTAAGQDNAAAEQIVKAMTTTVGKDKAIEQVMARAGQDVRWKLLAAALHSIHKEWDQVVLLLDDVNARFDELTPGQKVQALRISGPLYQLARPPQLDKAKEAYLKLLEIQPTDLFALNNLATLLVDDALVPQPQEAKKYSLKAYDQVRRAQPFPAAVLDTHGWVLIQCGEYDEGISILQRVTRQTSLPEAHYHLGEGWLKKNDPKKALAELKVASDTVSRANATAGIAASPDLEKKIQSATERAKEMQRAQNGAEAGAR